MTLSVNPIIVKELRSRMRGPRTYIILSIFLAGMAAICYAIIRVFESQAQAGNMIISAHVGKGVFAALALAETLLITFLTPAVTAGAISGEREQLTYDLLVATPLQPARILSGKLIATLSYILLLIFTAVPLGSLVLVFGGVAPIDLLQALALLVVTALTFGMIGLLCSSMVRRTITATILAYAIVLMLVVGSFFLVSLRMAAQPNQPPGRSRLIAASPFSAMASIIARGNQSNPMDMPMGPMPMDGVGLITSLPGLSMLTVGIIEYGPNGPITHPVYRWTIVGYSIAGLACYWLASHLVRPRRRWRIGLQDLFMLVSILIVSGLGITWLELWSSIGRRLGL